MPPQRVMFGLFVLLLSPASARAQLVQSTQSIALTAKATVETPRGAQIFQVRIGTRDLVEQIKEDLGVVGSGGSIVIRRDIDDLEFENSESLLLVNGVLHAQAEPFFQPADPNLPESFFGFVESFTRRASDGEILTFVEEGTSAITFGDLASEGLEGTLVGLSRRNARLASAGGIDLGYLFSSISLNAFGGMQIDEPELADQVLLLTGSVRNGPEKLVAP